MFSNKPFTALLFSLAIPALPALAQAPTAEIFGNSQILELHKLGLPDAAVIAKIKSVTGKYDTSIEGLKALKAAGISGEIITAILEAQIMPTRSTPNIPGMQADPNDPMGRYSAGIYLKGEGGKLIRLEGGKETTQTGDNYKGIGWFGSPTATTTYINDLEPPVVKPRRPEFVFYLAKKSGLNQFSFVPVANIALVPLAREGGRLIFVNRKRSDLTERMIHFKLEKIYNDTYKATPVSDLPDGDYAIMSYDSDLASTELEQVRRGSSHGRRDLGKERAKSQGLTGMLPFIVKGEAKP